MIMDTTSVNELIDLDPKLTAEEIVHIQLLSSDGTSTDVPFKREEFDRLSRKAADANMEVGEYIKKKLDKALTFARSIPSADENVRRLVEAAIERVSFGGCPFVTEISLDRTLGKLYTVINIVNRETGEPGSAQFSDSLPPVLASVEHAIDWIYARVRNVWIHELNEVFLVDGKQRRDLHDDKGGTIYPPEDVSRNELAEFKLQLAAFLMNHR